MNHDQDALGRRNVLNMAPTATTLNVIDKDGDVTLPGFFGRQEVSMLPAHDRHHVPLGKGTIEEVGDEAIAQIKMNLDII